MYIDSKIVYSTESSSVSSDQMGTCIWPQNLSKRLIKELIQGRDMATQLQHMLHKPPFGEHGGGSISSSLSAEELASKILNSFTQTLSVVAGFNNSNTTINSNSSDQTSQVNPDQASHCDDPSSDDSGESKKRSSSAIKDRRGCYKRRKNSQSWTTTVPTLEDGQAWRKYGQKDILNAEYPRAYFRCTRKYDQGCRATRQVQQIQDNPKLYQTTYIGEHTCKSILKAPQMIKDSEYTWESAPNNLNVVTDTSHHHNDNASKSMAIESDEAAQEVKPIREASTATDSCLSDKLSLDNDHNNEIINLWPSELKDLELSDPSMGLLCPRLGSGSHGHDNHVSIMFSFADRTTSATSRSFDMDEFVDTSIDFRSCDFEFDENEFHLGSL